MEGTYLKNVFINVPFDDGYEPLFHAVIFAISDCGFVARCAREAQDGGETRIDKLCKIISECKFGIHDISRVQLDKKSRLPRFNMPFELGLFCGAKSFVGKRPKICLILDKEKYRYQKFLSDISGQDIQAHNNKPEEAISVIRNWLHDSHPKVLIPSGTEIFKRYKKFLKAMPVVCKQLKRNPKQLTYNDYRQVIAAWQKVNPW
jgi:hypothetical protein